MAHYNLVPAGPATVTDSKTKQEKTNTIRVIVPSVEASDYPQYPTTTAKVKGANKTVIALEVPAAELSVPEFPTWEAFESEAKEMGKAAQEEARKAVNVILRNDSLTAFRKTGKDMKVIPTNITEPFANVPASVVKSFFLGVERAAKASERLSNAQKLAAEVDPNDTEAVLKAFAAMRAMLGVG